MKNFRNTIFFLAVFALVFLPGSFAFAAISCSLEAACPSPGVVVLKMSATANAHAELPNESNYAELLCCTGVTGLQNTCTDDFGVVLRLSSDTNAHVEENTEATPVYDGHNACLSVPDGTVTIGYANNSCAGFDAMIASISGTPTNAHIAEAAEYVRKVCATVTVNGAPAPSPGGGGGGPESPNVPVPPGCGVADFNCDGLVNILDLSILLYYSRESTVSSRHDLNQDGVINLRDISIMFYYWTK